MFALTSAAWGISCVELVTALSPPEWAPALGFGGLACIVLMEMGEKHIDELSSVLLKPMAYMQVLAAVGMLCNAQLICAGLALMQGLRCQVMKRRLNNGVRALSH